MPGARLVGTWMRGCVVHGMSGRRIIGLCLCVLGVGVYWV